MSTKDTVQKFARNVWLAGLGAYGKGAQTVTESIDKAYVESNQIFNDLVIKGTEIQTSLEKKLQEQAVFEQKVNQVREKLGLDQAVSDQQIDLLNEKLSTLTETIATLAEKRLVEATKVEASEQKSLDDEAQGDMATKEPSKPASKTRKTRTAKGTSSSTSS